MPYAKQKTPLEKTLIFTYFFIYLWCFGILYISK
nr:MAG TPA_asm: hypothetical protein [Caudoviricetes sp.]